MLDLVEHFIFERSYDWMKNILLYVTFCTFVPVLPLHIPNSAYHVSNDFLIKLWRELMRVSCKSSSIGICMQRYQRYLVLNVFTAVFHLLQCETRHYNPCQTSITAVLNNTRTTTERAMSQADKIFLFKQRLILIFLERSILVNFSPIMHK